MDLDLEYKNIMNNIEKSVLESIKETYHKEVYEKEVRINNMLYETLQQLNLESINNIKKLKKNDTEKLKSILEFEQTKFSNNSLSQKNIKSTKKNKLRGKLCTIYHGPNDRDFLDKILENF